MKSTFYAVIYSEGYEWDWGSEDLSKAIGMAKENGCSEIAIVEDDGSETFCVGSIYIEDGSVICHRDGKEFELDF